MGKEEQTLKDSLICFFEVVSTEGSWKFLHKLRLFFNVEQLLDIGMLLDVTIDLLRKRLTDMVFICKFLKDLQILALLYVLRANVGDQRTNTVDVVSEDDAADGLDEDHTQCFLIANWNHISESNGKHNRSAPVVRPYVLFIPRRLT